MQQVCNDSNRGKRVSIDRVFAEPRVPQRPQTRKPGRVSEDLPSILASHSRMTIPTRLFQAKERGKLHTCNKTDTRPGNTKLLEGAQEDGTR